MTFLTCAPNYPDGRVFPGYTNRLYRVEWLDGVRVVRTWSYITPCQDFWRRILNYGTFSASVFFGALLAGKPQAMMSYSPPLPLGISAWLLSKLWGVPWVLRVEDLFPDAAVAVGVLKNRTAIYILARLEHFLYRKAKSISLISDGFYRSLAEKGVPTQKMSVAPVWADPQSVRPQPKDNYFRQMHGLQGKFVVLYAGNLGYTSALEDVLAAAAQLRDDQSIHFLLVGEGVKKNALQKYAQEHNLEQVTFLPYQPRAEYSEMMAAADISLVTINSTSSPYSLPNKVFSIMASGRPILAVAPPESEIARLVQSACCGLVVPPGMGALLADNICQLKQAASGLDDMGVKGRAYLGEHFSRERIVDLFESTLRAAVG